MFAFLGEKSTCKQLRITSENVLGDLTIAITLAEIFNVLSTRLLVKIGWYIWLVWLAIVYFNQLLGAVRTQKLFKQLFSAVFNLFCSFKTYFSEFMAEINKKRLKTAEKVVWPAFGCAQTQQLANCIGMKLEFKDLASWDHCKLGEYLYSSFLSCLVK